jgi:error-prone DNA polymerase
MQLSLDLAESVLITTPSGLPEMSAAERVQSELSVLGLDASAHVVHFYATMLGSLGATRSTGLLSCRSNQEILVGGVKVATQTPPIRSGHRVVFLTLDDGAGPVDATFFPDAQDPYAQTVFGSWLLLVRGRVRRTGDRGVSLRATGCWDLTLIHRMWLAEGAPGVHAVLESAPRPDGSGTRVPAGRVRQYASGFRTSPYADIRPAGGDPADGRGIVRDAAPPPVPAAKIQQAPAKLWHSSHGSPGW